MDKMFKRYIIPLGILFVGSFLISFFTTLIPSIITGTLYNFLIVTMLFAFGFSLNNRRSNLKSFSWRHIIIILLLVFMFLYDAKVLHIELFDTFKSYVVADEIVIKVFYVYLGWLFVEK